MLPAAASRVSFRYEQLIYTAALPRLAAGAKAPASGKAPASSEAPASGKAPAKLPADKQSVTARLAKIERGKGPSEHNPLQGHASSSSSAGICRRKKGG